MHMQAREAAPERTAEQTVGPDQLEGVLARQREMYGTGGAFAAAAETLGVTRAELHAWCRVQEAVEVARHRVAVPAFVADLAAATGGRAA